MSARRQAVLTAASVTLLAALTACGGATRDTGNPGDAAPTPGAPTTSSAPATSGTPSSSAPPTVTAGSSAVSAAGSASAGSASAGSASAGSGRYPTYVALGDSYTAAPGVPTTETTDGCLRSSGNYPARLAATLGSSLTDVSCSGASTASLTGTQQTGVSQAAPQLDALTASTSLVTVGIGGNDEDLFATTVLDCVRAALGGSGRHPCENAETSTGSDVLLAKIPVIRTQVIAVLRQVHDRAPAARVVLVGYPQPVPTSGTCTALPLAAGDYAYVRTVFGALDQALRTAAQRTGTTYVDVAAASRGHDICSTDPWVNGAANAPGRAIAFHPFAIEQQAVAALVQRAVG